MEPLAQGLSLLKVKQNRSSHITITFTAYSRIYYKIDYLSIGSPKTGTKSQEEDEDNDEDDADADDDDDENEEE
jgi:hypothetical protein